ncbi:MAG: GNAT family N-acetyltransferase [Pseudolabrys sp.]
MTDDVRDNPDRQRFELDFGGGRLAVAEYRLAGGVLMALHTEVPKELEGRGIGSRLVRGVLAQARARGLKVRPICSFVRAYMDRHPEYADLRA